MIYWILFLSVVSVLALGFVIQERRKIKADQINREIFEDWQKMNAEFKMFNKKHGN